MPEFVVWAVAALGTAVGGTVGAFMIMNAAAIATGALLLGGLALSAYQRQQAARKARDAYNASLVDRMANVVTTIGQRELVLGRVRKAGTVFFRGSTGTDKEKFFMCVALAGHEIDAVETIYLNDVPVTLDGSGWVQTEPYALNRRDNQQLTFSGSTVTLTGGTIDASSIVVTRVTGSMGPEAGGGATEVLAYSYDAGTKVVTIGDSLGGTVDYQTTGTPSKAKITVHLGTSTQTADADLLAAFPDLWTTNHRAQGVAYLVCQFLYDETAFPSGIPAVSAVIRGAKCYDPRTGLITWTENPAIHARQILIHPQFGKRTSLSSAEEARISAAANACDTSTTYTVNGSPVVRPLFKSGYVVPFGSPAKQALDDVCQAMAGMWAYAAGEFYIKAGVYTAPVLTLTDADLGVVKRSEDGAIQQQAIAIATHKPRADMVNMITARIWREDEQWKKVALPPLAPASYLARDGAQLAHEIDMPAITYAPQALHVAGVMMRDDRDPLRVTLPFKLAAYPLELFDSVALTLARYGWSTKEFLVLGRAFTIDGLLQLTLKETSATIFQLDAGFAPGGTATNTALPKPWQIDPPTIVSVESGSAQFLYLSDGTVVPRVKITWAAITDQSILQGGWIELLYRLATDAGWRRITIPASETYVYIDGVADGTVLLFQMRTHNQIAASDWTSLQGHAVVGNSSAPAAPSGLTATAIIRGVRLTWTNPTSPDLDHIEVWVGTTSSIGAASHVADVKGTTYDYANLTAAAGTRYFWVRAVNTSGNHRSFAGPASAASDTITTGDVGTGVVNKFNTAVLYQWATSTPGDPSGTSTWTWATGAHSGYTGGAGWSTTIPANPGTAGAQLWECAKQITDDGSATTTTVSWTSGFTKFAAGQNTAGVQTAQPAVYQWAASIPTISGTSTYTWSTGGISSVPAGWSTSPGSSPTAGYTLWKAFVTLSDTAGVATTSINWTGASIMAAGYAGGNGTNGSNGTNGTNGLSARVTFARVASNPAPVAGNITTSGSSSFPSSAQSTATWGFAATWGASDPNPSSTDSLYQADGIYDPSTGNTTWSTPYISSLKVGQLSAVATSTGSLTVDSTISVATTGSFSLGKTSYTDTVNNGIWYGYTGGVYKLVIGNTGAGGSFMQWDGSTLMTTAQVSYHGIFYDGQFDNTATPSFPAMQARVVTGVGANSNPAGKFTGSGSAYAIEAWGNKIFSDAGFATNSSTVVTNLNADLLDGNHAAAFAAASHTHVSFDRVSATSPIVGHTLQFVLQDDRNIVGYDNGVGFYATSTTASDQRLKTAIRETSIAGLATVNQLQVVDFQWGPDTPFADGGIGHTGFIAQSVKTVVPDAVKEVVNEASGESTMMLHKEELVPALVKAVQELSAKVAELEARLG